MREHSLKLARNPKQGLIKTTVFAKQAPGGSMSVWVAVKELKLSYHNGYI